MNDVPVIPTPRSAQRPAPWPVAAAYPLLCVACLLGVVLLAVQSHAEPVRYGFGDGVSIGYGATTALIGLAVAALGAVVLRWAEHPLLGWTLGGVGLFWALDGLSEAYVRLGTVTDHALPAMTFAVWFLARFTALLPATIVVLPLVFPEGRFLRGWWGGASWVCLAAMSLSALAMVVTPYRQDTSAFPPGVDPDPTTIWALAPYADGLVAALQLSTVLGVVVPVAVVVHRYRGSSGTGRDEMRWLLWGAVMTAALVAVALVVDLGPLDAVVFFTCITLVPAAMTVAVVSPRVVAIDDLLARTVVVAVLALLLVVVDFAVVAALSLLIDDSMAQSEVVLVVLLTTVLLYGPIRQRLSRAVRRLVLGERSNRYDVVAGLATTLESAAEAPAQLTAVARAVAGAFGVGFVSVEVDRAAGERLVATYGRRPEETRTLPITYRDAEVGRLVLPARGLRSRLSRRDEELLGDLVRQAATAARSGQLADELQASRERLVTAREEERRRIRRDLHDGLGPALSGVVFQLESARLLVDRDPAAAQEQLAGISRHVQDVVADVRRLVHDLRPPALDDRGLVGAVRQLGERLDPPVVVEADELGVLPAAVEVAAYRIAGEAMTNVARHAGATRCTVRLEVAEGALLVEVADDGVGVPPDVQAGVGLVGLRERAAELGGRAEVTCPPTGGTVVRAWLPLRSTP